MVDRKKIKATTGLALYKSMIRIEFGTMREFVEDINTFLFREAARIEERIEKEIKESPELAGDIVDWSIDDLHKYGEEFVGIFLNSSLVAAYSLFEKSLVSICDMAANEFKVSHPNSYIKGCKTYLERDLKIKIDDLDGLWNKIDQYREIRNMITHNDSNVRRYVKKLKGSPARKWQFYRYVLSQRTNIKLKRRGKAFVSNEKYVLDFCDAAEAYLNEVTSRLIKNT